MNKTWDKEEWRRLHAEYLKSPEWAEVQKAVIERDEKCQRCRMKYSSDGGFDVHHKHYKFWRQANWEECDSCELLCRGCHFYEHFSVSPEFRLDQGFDSILCDCESYSGR